MARNKAPIQPSAESPLVNNDGRLTMQGLQTLLQMWRQISAGFVIVPCSAEGTNDIVLTPVLGDEGAESYGFGMTFAFEAENTSTGAVTVQVGKRSGDALEQVKGYISDGAAQAGNGDIVADSLYLATYSPNLDGGAGGFVIK